MSNQYILRLIIKSKNTFNVQLKNEKFLKIFFLSFFLLFLSCEDDNVLTEELSDYRADFDSLWNNYDKIYPLFTYKKVDWLSLKNEYREKFNNISENQRADLFVSILSKLKDGHILLNISSEKPIFTYINRNHDRNFNEEYLSKFINSNKWRSINTYFGWTIKNNVGYIRLSSFVPSNVDTIIFDSVLDSLHNTDGIVIDIRKNIGGNLITTKAIWNRFTNKAYTVGYQQYRNGPDHNDFAPNIPIYAKPKGTWQYLNPVVILIGRYCGSAGEIFAETVSYFDNVTILGDTTAGIVTAARNYELPDGFEYTLPVVAIYNNNGIPLEWNGVAPDIYLIPELVKDNKNKDIIIEKAFEIINGAR